MSQSIMSALKRLHLAMEQYGKMQMSHTDLTPAQAALLYYLLTHEDQGNCGIQLHATLGISKSSISSTLKALRLKGYICTKGNPLDDRKKQIFLTQKAYDAEPHIHAGLLAQQKLLCRQIPEQRLRQFSEDLEQMLRNLTTEMRQEAKI